MGRFGGTSAERARHAVRVVVTLTVSLAMFAALPAEARVKKPTSSVLFSDNFENLAVDLSWIDGSRHGAWKAVYNGYGVTQVVSEESKHLAQAPLISTQPDETHANLATTTKTFSDVSITMRLKTVRHLRLPEPNPWETAWALWNYTDDLHFYYIALKPNGWELGKEDPAYPGAQRFLATGSERKFPIGQWYNLRIRQVNNEIDVWVDGVHLVRFVDRERPYRSGRLGLYNEDADVRFDDILVKSPTH